MRALPCALLAAAARVPMAADLRERYGWHGVGVDTTPDGVLNTFDPSQNAEVMAEDFEFERVGGRGGDKQTHAGAKVFSSNWGFGADHGDQNVSDAERFTSHSRAQMAKGAQRAGNNTGLIQCPGAAESSGSG